MQIGELEVNLRITLHLSGQARALRAKVIETSLSERANTIEIRWTPSHAGVEGNERADLTAKRAAEDLEERAEVSYLREASLSYLRRVTTENRTKATAEWIRERSGRQRRYRPPKGGRMRKALNRTRKELAGRYYQLLSGHAAVAEHLKRVGQMQSDRCFWCGTGERQTRFHLFVKCRRWKPEIEEMWKKIKDETAWGGAPTVRKLFGDERCVGALLEFLDKTKVGKMPSRILLAGGPDLEEEELESLSLLAQDEGVEETDISESEEESGPGPPL